MFNSATCQLKLAFESFEEIPAAVATALRRPGRLFVDAYMDDVDKAAHAFGPDSAELDRLVARVLTLIGDVADECAERGARLVLFADHGQVPTLPGDFLHVDRVCRHNGRCDLRTAGSVREILSRQTSASRLCCS